MCEPISTAFVESSVNEIIAKRIEQEAADALEQGNGATLPRRAGEQRRLNNNTLADAFRHRYPGFRPVNDDQATAAAA